MGRTASRSVTTKRTIGIVRPANSSPGPMRRSTESKRTPGRARAFISRAIAPASVSHGAPTTLRGASVPRPSLAVAASKNTVPG